MSEIQYKLQYLHVYHDDNNKNKSYENNNIIEKLEKNFAKLDDFLWRKCLIC